jgi:beta-xylosidase
MRGHVWWAEVNGLSPTLKGLEIAWPIRSNQPMSIRLNWIRLTGCVALIGASWGLPTAGEAESYLFTSFRGNGESGLHLAISQDGYRWRPLNRDQPFLRPEVGGKLMRDPCLAQGSDGRFHLVWTTSWTADSGKIVGYSSSTNLVDWTPQRAIEVMQHEPTTRNIWAPEIFYDDGESHWLIFWSSTIPGRFPATDETGDNGYNHRIYYTTTRDFLAFTESRLFYDPGFNVIDATLLQVEDQYHLFIKDERRHPVKKHVLHAVGPSPTGPFGPLSGPITQDWVEGPSAIRIGEEYIVYWDHYARPQFYGAVRSRDLKTWEDCTEAMSFPPGHRHGSVLRIPSDLARQLSAH